MTAALLARSQARMQLRAEHQRALREPRKSAYVAFAERWRSREDLLQQAWIELSLAAENRESSECENLLERASTLHSEATEMSVDLQHAEALVYVEGPGEVTNAAIGASRALVDLLMAVHGAVIAVQRGEVLGDRATTCEDAISAAHMKYLDFLHEASDALGGDVLQ
ncbi:hypothetical protein [Streptomyces sp. enrichment culture]|uniref:hypothetical protein n=1 Tax=Streptomyces sp. enrichment culture TaxID=1795815 RepID=UPI003F54CE19